MNARVYMIGGGDYKSLPETMYQCKELEQVYDSPNFNLQFKLRKNMKFARHGHSVCTIGGRYILVSGSRKEVNQAANRVELYDIQIDEWVELAKINEGRHYHSSCNINNSHVYIFGGIQNSNKKYSASIEKMKFSLDNFNYQWEKVNLSSLSIQNPNSSLTAR